MAGAGLDSTIIMSAPPPAALLIAADCHGGASRELILDRVVGGGESLRSLRHAGGEHRQGLDGWDRCISNRVASATLSRIDSGGPPELSVKTSQIHRPELSSRRPSGYYPICKS
jgi:hypothetical protein